MSTDVIQGMDPTPDMDPTQRRLTGVGGWLLFYLILQVMNVLFSLAGAFTPGTSEMLLSNQELGAALGRLQKLFLPINVILALALTVTLILIAKGKKSAIKITAIVLSSHIAVAVAYGLMSAKLMTNLGGQFGTAPAHTGMAVSLLYNIAWLMYFKKSQRVQYTLRH